IFLAFPALLRRLGLELRGGVWPVLLFLSGPVLLSVVPDRVALALPPWPLLGALATIVLGAGVVALAEETPVVHLLSVLAAAVVLLRLAASVQSHPWPPVVLLAGAGLAGVGVLGRVLAGR